MNTPPLAGSVPAVTGTVAAAGSPFQRPLAFGRRTLLAGLLGLGVGAYLDTSPMTSWTAYAAKPKLTAGSIPTPPGPYAIAATSELSDDVFATNEVLIGPDDEVLPFYNPASQAVEALVLSGATVFHLHRDPTQATGWAYAEFDLQGTLTSVTSVAVAADGTRVYALLWGNPDPQNNWSGSPYWLTWLNGATSWDEGYVAPIDDDIYPPDPGPIKGGISREGVPYFYTSTVSGTTTSLTGWVATGEDDEPLSAQDYLDLDISSLSGTVQDFLILYDTNATNTVGYALVLFSTGVLSVYAQQDEIFPDSPLTDAGSTGVTELMWAWASPSSTTGVPGYAFQGNVPSYGEGAYFCDEDGNFTRVSDAPETGSSTVAVWLMNDQYTVNLLDSDGTLQTIQQTAPGVFADPLPIANGVPGSVKPGLVAVYGVPTDPTRATLFGVGADETLSVLTLDDTGWTQTQVQQDDVVASAVSCYRVTMSVLDSNGSPIRYGQAQVSSDRLVGLWQDTGSTILVPGTPVTLTGDLSGQITFSVPAEELDTAVLTAQALDGSGQPSGSPLTVAGDYDVRSFLGGSAALNDLGTMQASTLTGAKNPDGSTLLPGLDSDSAGAVVKGLSGAIAAGSGQAPAADAVKAYKLERHGTKLTASTSRNAKEYGETAVSSSIGSFFHSLGHALRHALAKVTSAVVRWADDLKQWVVELATDLTQLAAYAINDMRDAFHVIGGWFSTLGADIKKAITWLKREILGVLTGVGKNATTIGNLLGDGPNQLIGIVQGIEKQVDGWFAQQETTVTGWITELASAVEDATFGSSQPLSSPPSDTGSSTAMNDLSTAIGWMAKVVNDSPGKWLYDKLMQHLPQTPGPDLSGVFDQVLQDLTNAWKDSVDLAADIATTLWDSFRDLSSKGALTETKVSDWFGDINAVVVKTLQLCDAIADAVLDFVIAALKILDDYLSYEWSLTSIRPILKLILDELGFDPTISLQRLVSLVTAFPLTLVRTLTGLDPVFSTGSDAATATSDSGDRFCYTTAAISQFIWTIADVGGDFELMAQEGASSRPQQPGIIDYFDIICPLLQTLLLLPGRDNNLIWNGLPTDTNLPGLLPGTVFSSIVPSLFKIAAKAKAAAPTPDPDVIQYYQQAPAQADPLAQYYDPIVSMLAAMANAVLGGWYSYKNATDTTGEVEAIVGAVLGNASNLTAPLTTYWLNASLEDVPVIVKIIIDGVAGLGAGALYAGSA